MPGRNGRTLLRADALLADSPVGESERRALATAVADQGRVTRVASIGVGEICPTPEAENSRSARSYDPASIQEMADSIGAVGIIQPIVVRPIQPHEAERYALCTNGQTTYPQYVIIAGNRRYHGAVAAGRTEVPCVIRVTDADSAFILNIIENIARRALSGTERARSLARLASMQDPEGRSLGVAEIARRTGFGLGTISQWLAIHRSPVLMEALASDKLDIGRAMKLAPLAALEPDRLEEVVAEAAALTQPDVQRLVSAIRRRPEVVARRVASVNARRVMEAYRRLMLVDTVDGEVREALELVARRVSELRGALSLSESLAGGAASS